MNAERWPVDFEKLQRGDIIPAARVEEWSGVERSDRNYSLYTMRLVDDIKRHFARERGEVVSVVCRQDDICVLTVPEQALHTRKAEVRRRQSYMRNLTEGLAVEPQLLADEEQKRHREWQLRASWRQQQMLENGPGEDS